MRGAWSGAWCVCVECVQMTRGAGRRSRRRGRTERRGHLLAGGAAAYRATQVGHLPSARVCAIAQINGGHGVLCWKDGKVNRRDAEMGANTYQLHWEILACDDGEAAELAGAEVHERTAQNTAIDVLNQDEL
jgi:hypothetical protein